MINLFKHNKVMSLILGIGLLCIAIIAVFSQLDSTQPVSSQGGDSVVKTAVEVSVEAIGYKSGVEILSQNNRSYLAEIINGSVRWSVGYMWSDKLLWADDIIEQVLSFVWTSSYRGYSSRGLM